MPCDLPASDSRALDREPSPRLPRSKASWILAALASTWLTACGADVSGTSPEEDAGAGAADAGTDAAPEGCSDGAKSGGESDVDCGGPSCAACQNGKACSVGGDCQSGVCSAGVCQAPSCTDGQKDGAESDVDCGGGACPPCAAGEACNAASDCASGVCAAGVCQSPSCADGALLAPETDVDCGGPECAPCADGKGCLVGADCASLVCAAGVCAQAACDDAVKNGDETGVDCGGSCAPCADGGGCVIAGDCQSGVCAQGVCLMATCADGVKNLDETDVDCGGPECAPCADEGACGVAEDCQSLVCSGGVCQVAACDDGVKNAAETDVDCGGGACGVCADGKACTVGEDCQSLVCSGGVCQVAACDDGVKNAAETDVDCGGGACGVCGYSKGCSVNTDCSTKACVAGVCEHAILTLAAGGYHACAILGTGTLKCWGFGSSGELGHGATSNLGDGANEMGSNLPAVDLGAGHHAISVSAGVQHTCAVLENGSVKCWGLDDFGQLGLGDTANRGDGPGEMGDNLPAVDLGAGRTAKAVFAGHQHTCAILDDGSVKCWGRNDAGQLGIGDTVHRGDGPGEMGDSLPTVNLGAGRTAVSLSLADVSTCALLDDGTAKCWGNNGGGMLGQGHGNGVGGVAGQMGDNLPPIDLGAGRTVKDIRAGYTHACALLDNGAVKCWGYNADGRLGVGDTTHRGNVAGQMGDNLPAINLGTGRTATKLTSAANSMCAVLDDGTVKCWGLNSNGVLGIGDTAARGATAGSMGDNLPVTLLGTGRSVRMFAGAWFSVCAALDDETLKCWGANNRGQLGLGDTAHRGDNANEMGDNLPVVSLP